MKFKLVSMAVVVGILVILYVFVGCGRTDIAPNQDGQTEVQ
jgi:hypothetical protein